MRKRFVRHNASVVDQKLCRKIVRSVQNKVVIGNKRQNVPAVYEVVENFHVHVGIDTLHRFLCRLHFGLSQIIRRVDDLTLQVGQIDGIRIGNTDFPYACRRKIHCRRCAESACADNKNFRRGKFFLPFYADLFQNNMSRIAFKLLVGKTHFAPPPM